MEGTESCTFNNGNTNVFYNLNLCGYLDGPDLFMCPPNEFLGYSGQTACLPTSNSTTGFAEVVNGYLTEDASFITVDLTQVAYSNAYTSWQPVASSGSQSLSMTTTWSTSSSTTHNSTHASTFSASVKETVKFQYGIAKSKTQLSASTTQYVSESTSTTLEQTNSGSTTVTCDAASCEDGILYQWNVNAEDMYGNEAAVQSCDFQCVPFLNADYPKCPLGFCSSPACNCCNGIWKEDDSSADGNFLDNRLEGGTCTAFEVQFPNA